MTRQDPNGMSHPRPGAKRGLREVLEAGVARDETRAAKLVTVVFDVNSSTGEHIGLAMHARDGRPVYVDPPALKGVEVMYPMVIESTPNARCLAASLSRVLQTELSR